MSDAAITHFLETVYPDVEDGWLVLSYPDTTALKSDWFDVAHAPWQRIAQAATRRAQTTSVYFGVALQHPACEPLPSKRGSSATAYLVPGLWFDLDLAYGQHAASTLPQTDREALQFLAALQARPSLIIHSGGGLYGWWLFKELYLITSEDDRERIAHLSRQFTYTLVQAGKQRGWTLDALGDLARVLRPPGTINHKYGKLVELIHEGHERYNPSDFDWLEPLAEPARTQHNGSGIDGQPDLVVIAEHYGTTLEHKSSTELAGAHPQHGSSTGSNFNVNLSKGLWHCWRHGTGGDALALIAVCEGLLSCEAAVSGAIRGDLFRHVVDVANEKFDAALYLDAQQRRNGSAPGPHIPDPYACPELPAYARIDDAAAAHASRFLDAYTAFSQRWSPRAYAGFHVASALFCLSTVAARRVRVAFGPHGVYTSLYMALTGRTTLFSKTTTAELALRVLRQAGLGYLLADDDATPQAFLRALTQYVPANYQELSPEEQDHTRMQLAFTAQRGWFYDEWGQHLEAMMAKNGFMANFRGILRRLDDHKQRYVYSTISRGRDIILKPYLSLLANVTLADLRPFVQAGKPLWRDGYIARMAFVTPESTDANDDPFPEGDITVPGELLTPLQQWHKRLGVPTAIITARDDAKGKPTGGYAVEVTPLPEKVYRLTPEVRTAYYAYDKAMIALLRERHNEDLDGSYGRCATKALRIAGLLASLQDDDDSYTIKLPQWYRGQQIAEQWRYDLHRLIRQVQSHETPSRQAMREERILQLIGDKGPQTIGGLHTLTKWPRSEIRELCEVLVLAEALVKEEGPRAVKYALYGNEI